MAVITPKEEMVAFDDMVAGFEDGLVLGQEIETFNLPGSAQDQARYSDKVWRPVPFNPAVFDGFDQTSNFGNITQLAVPVSVGQHKVVPVSIGPKDGRDEAAVRRYFDNAAMTLASQVNQSILTTAVNNASVVSRRTTPATGFNDLAQMAAIFTERGVPGGNRKAFYSSRDYLGMAAEIAKPATSASPLSQTAYERAYIKTIGGFDLFENDQPAMLAAAAATGVTITNAQPLFYTPVAATIDSDGNSTNVDNRRQVVSIAVTSGTVKVGDALTIAGVNAVHRVSKANTGQLMTFRVTRIVTGAGGTGTVEITPPIVSGAGGTRAELENRNVSASPVNGAAVTFLNTTTAQANLFFVKGAIELIPGSFAVNGEDGWNVVAKGTTPKLGLPITYVRQGNINDLSVKARVEVDFGVGALAPEMIGIQLFGQA